jgi:hypothetical protein
MNFSLALELLKGGARLTRTGWNGKELSISIQFPNENSKMTRPYIYMIIPSRVSEGAPKYFDNIPWLASQTDLLADDWEVFNN